ncbi:MAG: hypothetical protein AB1782_15230 [Cyanobacteriota bacterium]
MFKDFRKKVGSGLVDYILPTALVGLVLGLALYKIYDDKSLNKFIEGSMDANVDSNGTLIIE